MEARGKIILYNFFFAFRLIFLSQNLRKLNLLTFRSPGQKSHLSFPSKVLPVGHPSIYSNEPCPSNLSGSNPLFSPSFPETKFYFNIIYTSYSCITYVYLGLREIGISSVREGNSFPCK